MRSGLSGGDRREHQPGHRARLIGPLGEPALIRTVRGVGYAAEDPRS